MQVQVNTRDINYIYNEISRTSWLIKFNKNNEKYKKNLTVLFNKAIQILTENIHASVEYREVFIIKRIIVLNELYDNTTIFVNNNRNYMTKAFIDKIRSTKLFKIQSRINGLRQLIGELGRLPFSKGKERKSHIYQSKLQLASENRPSILQKEKEFFHLLGNDFSGPKIKQIDVSNYEGFSEISSLFSWMQIISRFMQNGHSYDYNIGNNLLEILKKTNVLSDKVYFYLKFYSNNQFDLSNEILYYQDLLCLKQINLSPKSAQTRFLKKYKLRIKNSLVPKRILENELAWDMKDLVNQLAPGKSQIFMCGIKPHTIIIKIVYLLSQTYTYEIFNTGDGINQFHRIKKLNNKSYVRPLIYRNLLGSVFSYIFFEKLMKLALSSQNIEEFYGLHEEFLGKSPGAIKEMDCGKWTESQKYSTCVYQSLGMGIASYLTKKQIRRLNIAKASYAIESQRKLIEMVNASKLIYPPEKPLLNIQASQVLLSLGEEYQKSINNIKKDF